MKPLPTWKCTVCGKAFQPKQHRRMPDRPCCGWQCNGKLSGSLRPQLPERFWLFVDKQAGGCWHWTGHLTRQGRGYGLMRMGGKKMPAHRVAWSLLKGAIPDGLNVCHHCDNPKCVNPDHLFLGTQKDNIQDAMQKGRMKMPWQQPCIAPTPPPAKKG